MPPQETKRQLVALGGHFQLEIRALDRLEIECFGPGRSSPEWDFNDEGMQKAAFCP
jgi:hypothetical protein